MTNHAPSTLGFRLALFAAVAVVGNLFGTMFRYSDIGSAVFYLPYAASTAALVTAPRREWRWFIAAGAVVHFATHWPEFPLTWVLATSTANIVRALLAAVLIQRWLGSEPRLNNLPNLAVFGIAAVVLAPAAAAIIGATNLVMHRPGVVFADAWTAWFVSNALTGLTMLPFFLAAFGWLSEPRVSTRPALWVETVLLGTVLAATSMLLYSAALTRQRFALPIYASVPILIWSSVRFGPAGASAALMALEFATLFGVDHGAALNGTAPQATIVNLQIFLTCVAVPILCLAAVARAREDILMLYRSALASLRDHVAILDADAMIIEANESWRRAAEGDVPLMHRASIGEGFLIVCEVAAARGEIAAGAVVSGVKEVLAGDRKRFEYEYEGVELGSPESYVMIIDALERPEGGAVVTRRNVTARRRAQKEILEQRDQLLHLNRVETLGHLSGAFAHELLQPLSAILGNAEVARRRMRTRPVDADSIAEILDEIIADDHRAVAVIDRLRALLRRGQSDYQAIAIEELIRDVLAIARTELLSRHVEGSVHVDPELPAVRGDRVQLQQVLLNLVINACEAIPADAPAHNRRVAVVAKAEESGGVHVMVRDSGTGIPESVRDQLFKPFVTTKPNGLGLGLSICQKIVIIHGGRLWAESNPEGGTTMHCTLPPASPRGSAGGSGFGEGDTNSLAEMGGRDVLRQKR